MFHVKHTRHTQKAFPYTEKAARRIRDGGGGGTCVWAPLSTSSVASGDSSPS